MSGVYSMTGGPTYAGASASAWMQDALDTPLSLFSTLGESAKSGVLDSFGLGTFIKDKMLPAEAPSVPGAPRIVPNGEGGFTYKRETPEEMSQRRADMGALTEDQYKASPYYRENIPWDAGMTTARAAALAQFDDAKKARDFFAQKRPFWSFVGGLGGQAVDPINWIPVFGETIQAAQVARFGYVGGHLLLGAGDAALNTGIAGVLTAEDRAKFGEDVSWQTTVSQMATAALLGGAFGALHGVFEGRGARTDATVRADAESRLSDLKTTQEARIALNEGIDAIVRGEDVRLSPNATDPMARVADEIAPTALSGDTSIKVGSETFHFDNGRAVGLTPNGEEKILGAAVKIGNDVYISQVHADAIDLASRKTGLPVDTLFERTGAGNVIANVDGFLTNRGRFVDRAEAADIAAAADQVAPIGERSRKQSGDLVKNTKELFAEQLDQPLRQQIDALLAEIKALDHVAPVEMAKRLDALEEQLHEQQRAASVAAEAPAIGQPIAVTRPAIDTSVARSEPRSEGVKQAEASIAKPEDTKALADQFSVDPNTGAFPEEAEVAQLASEGRLTPDDAVTLAQAEADYHTGSAFAEALKSVAGCLL